MLIKRYIRPIIYHIRRLSFPTSGRSPSYKSIESAEARLLAGISPESLNPRQTVWVAKGYPRSPNMQA